jgi:hypothetical protein
MIPTREVITMIRKAAMLGTLLALTATAAGAATTDRWLHVRVEESGDRGERVKVNIPLAMLEAMAGAIDLEAIDGDAFRGGRLRIDDADIDQVDLRAMWNAVKDADDMEFVTVETPDESVRVAKDSGYLLVRVRSARSADEAEGSDDEGRGEKVDVKVPLAVVDALLSAGENELDLRAALTALAAAGEGELVVIEDGRSSVRIWIDDRNTSE